MDNRPIGVFDSGLGGLTAVKELKKIMPHEDIIYLGDTARVPYGSRSEETLIKYTVQDINFLLTHDIKAIVVACGTASSVSVPKILDKYDVPIFDVVKPTVLSAISGKKGQKIGIIGTKATIKSGSYEKLIKEISSEKNLDIKVFAKACPLFVPLVEAGRISEEDKVTNLVIEEYLEEFEKEKIDTLILGCTHYPLIASNILNFLGGNVELISAGVAVSKHLAENIDCCQPKEATYKYFATDDTKSFGENAKIFLGEEILDKTSLIDIGKY